MANSFNYGEAQLRKIKDDVDAYGIKIDGRYYDSGNDGGETHHMILNKDQYEQLKALIVSFGL